MADYVMPEDLMVVNRKEFEKFQNKKIDEPVRGDKKWLKDKLDIHGEDKFNEILDTFRDELDMDEGGMIHYPARKGDPLAVIKKPFSEWLENNANRVYGGKK